MIEFSEFDKQVIEIIRNNVDLVIEGAAFSHDKVENVVLDIAPQDHAGAKKYFELATVHTLDINPSSGADFISDLCAGGENSPILKETYDVIICTEVLEHTLNPFKAVEEIHRMLKTGGEVYVTTPFNFRIHGPSPDAFRFTKDGLKSIFSMFEKVNINQIETPGRPNMPIAYTLRARK